MIARITGKLVDIAFTQVIIDVNGVGYRIFIPMSTFDTLPKIGEECVLKTYMNVREDALQLYGFKSDEERALFELLISVSGVGPKVALNVLSCMPVSSFCSSIATADAKAITKINGLGKKTAERLILELKDKIDSIGIDAVSASTKVVADNNQEVNDAIFALEQLGYKRDKSTKIINKIILTLNKEEISTANLIRKAISNLNS